MLVTIDTETYRFRPGRMAPRMVCLQWRSDVDAPRILLRDAGLAFLRELLQGHDTIGGANLAYDLAVAAAADDSLLPLIYDKLDRGEAQDTHIREALHDIARGCLFLDPETLAPIGRYSVELLARRYLGLDLSFDKKDPRSWRTRYVELDGVPLDQWPAEAVRYALDDAEHEHAILHAQDGHENLHDEPAQIRSAWSLHLASVWGIRTDPAEVAAFCKRVEVAHNENRRRFLAAGLLKIRTCIRKQGVLEEPDAIDLAFLERLFAQERDDARRGMYRKAIENAKKGKAQRYATDTTTLRSWVTAAYYGTPPMSDPTDRFPSGQVKTDSDTLEQSGDDLLTEFAGTGPGETLWKTFRPVVKRGIDVPINPRYNVLVETGRISCSDPNLTNIPRTGGVRECFVPRPGWVLSSTDYGSGELCTLAEVLHTLNDGPTPLGDVLRANRDPHIFLAAQIAATTYEDIAARIKSKDAFAKDLRQMAKAGNFGLPGGLGEAKLVLFARGAYGNLCELSGRVTRGGCGRERVLSWKGRQIKPTCVECLDVARELKQAWFAAYPEMEAYFAWINGEVEREGRIVQLVSNRIRGGVGFCDAANSMFQGLLADAAKRAFYLISRESYARPRSALYGSRPVILVHDETIAEHPADAAPEAAELLAKIMRDTLQEYYCPHVPIKAEPALMRRWLKGAETFRDARGRLVPCDRCPSCEAIVPEAWEHDELRDGAKTGRKCTGARAAA